MLTSDTAHDGRAGCAALFIDPANRASFDYAALLAHCRKSLPKYAVPLFLRIIDEQALGHNNKQNKVPLRNEGIDIEKIRNGTAGPKDMILWCPSANIDRYKPFGEKQWSGIVGGSVRL